MDRSRLPPLILEGVVAILLPAALREEVLGDMRERFADIAASRGRREAARWYRHQMLVLRPWALRRRAARMKTEFRRVADGRGRRPGGSMWGGSWTLDGRQALRSLRSRPAASLTVVLTVALAVGATTAVFSVVDGVLLRPLPFPDSGRLVRVWQTKASWMDSPRPQLRGLAAHYPFSVPTFDDLQSRNHSFSAVGAYAGAELTFTGDGHPEVVYGQRATSGLFRTLGVDPVFGRYLTPDDDRPGAAPVIVLGYGLWRDRFGSDPHILGRDLHLGDETRTVVGVMPPGFSVPGEYSAFWTSLPEDAKSALRDDASYAVLGRLRPGATLPQAAADADAVASRLAKAYPDAQGDLGIRMESLLDSVVGGVRATLLLLLGAVGLVLVIACVNIANVLSVLGLARRRELAVKAALGAASGRLARGRLVESLLLAGLGGTAGVGLSTLALPLLTSILPPQLPRRDVVSVNLGVLAFGLGVTLLTALLVGLIPALQASRIHPARTMRESGRSLAGGRSGAVRSAFVVAEVALAFVLMVAAGLLGNSFERLWHVDRGFDTAGLAEMIIVPDADHYPQRVDRDRFTAELRTRLSALPGIRVSATSQVPLSGSISSTSYLVERSSSAPDSASGVLRSAVLDNYFAVMRIPLVAGRSFGPADAVDAPPVAVVNEAMAREYWPGRSALGKRIRRQHDGAPWMTVVGVAGNVRHMGLDTPVGPKVYMPASQSDDEAESWVIRTHGNMTTTLGLVRDALAQVSPATPVTRTQILAEHVAASVAVPRFRAYFVIGLAAMAAILALLGVYGVTSFVVSQRTREIGVRIALGSEPGALVRRIIAGGVRLTAVGLAVGLGVAIPATRLVKSFLFRVAPNDPVTFVLTAALVALVGGVAAFLPARRAALVDPVEVLNDE